MNLSAENINKIRELVRSGYPLKARDAQDLQGHNDHLIELLEARFRLMLGLEVERDQLKAECEGLRADAERFRYIEQDADSGMSKIYGDDWVEVIDAAMSKESAQ